MDMKAQMETRVDMSSQLKTEHAKGRLPICLLKVKTKHASQQQLTECEKLEIPEMASDRQHQLQ